MLDDIDRRILATLQTNAALSLAELADRVGLSKNPCWRRVKRLEEDGVIRGRVALLDGKRLNLGLTAFIAVRTNQHTADWLETFAAAVRDLPEIVGAFRMTGDVDYLLHAVVSDMKAYDALYQRLIDRIELSDVSSSFVMEEIKQTTALPLNYA
ncbi:MAG: Lrp/AsnC family transcriptional regulator [Inquilinus sp.]|nr:Lrp/AsnC family transcriptional regulator [Inquilinus sp.]